MVEALYLRNNHLNELILVSEDYKLCCQYWILKQFFYTATWHICTGKVLVGKIIYIYQDNLKLT